MDWLINNLPAIILVVGFIAGYYNYLKDHDPALAQKIKVIGELANYAVSLQATKDYSNKEKQAEATKAVMEQAKAVGIKVTEATAKGAVEQAVAKQKEETPKQVTTENKTVDKVTEKKEGKVAAPTKPQLTEEKLDELKL
ncbi:phage holin [Lactobacillus jensenii]|uniref:phage holin n=1 Tax=Lactobacillus TaxID=1578 RepID=UPI001195CD12|nr:MULTISPECIES: phage holin [Lactobacillus]MCZ9641989.1 phage holin [Lactobacillus jensenii]MCZ9655586.1 phage holin [Lactobacillus iners]MCZ9656514.1 phage holin [Lactobacillus jensenii]MCZ9660755.1 phage holin [Lactobacillus jensenii]MCZ9664725.1 phage holin [Lactobacillus jensenii]